MDRQTKAAVTIAVVALLVLLILALYGYLTGAWDASEERAGRPPVNHSVEGHLPRYVT